MRKVAIISDIHSNIEALDAVMSDITSKGINKKDIYCCGDIVGYGPNPNEVIECFKENKIESVKGNNDNNIVAYIDRAVGDPMNENRLSNSLLWTSEALSENGKKFLRKLRSKISIKIGAKTILLVHGSPFSLSEYVYEDSLSLQEEIADTIKEDMIVFGHTHIPYMKKINGKIFINVGSVGKSKINIGKAEYCILEVGDESEELTVEFIVIDYDRNKLIDKMKSESLLKDYINLY